MLHLAVHAADKSKDCVLNIEKEHAKYLNTASNGVWQYFPFEPFLNDCLANNNWEVLFRAFDAYKIPTTLHKGIYKQIQEREIAGGEDTANQWATLRTWAKNQIDNLL